MLMDGESLISGSLDRAIRVWSTATGECEHTVDASSPVYALTKCGDEKLVSGQHDSSIIVWNTSTWTCERTLAGHTSHVMGLAITNDGRKMLSGSDDGSVKVWDTASWECERTIEIGSNVFSILVSGSTVFSGCESGDIAVSNWETGEREGTLEGHADTVRALAICGGKLSSGSDDYAIKVWA